MTSAEQLINELAHSTIDNEPGSVAKLQQVANFFKPSRWPPEYARTTHTLHPGDARDLSWIPARVSTPSSPRASRPVKGTASAVP